MHLEITQNDSTRFVEKFREVARLLQANPGSDLWIEPGEYAIGDDETEAFERSVIDGSAGHVPALFVHGIPHQEPLVVEDCDDIAIHARGVVIRQRGLMQPLTFRRCRNLTVEGFTFTHDRLPFSHGEILSDSPDYTDIRFADSRWLTSSTPTLRTVTWHQNRYWAATQSARCFRMLDGEGLGRFEGLSSAGMKGAEIYVWHTYHFRTTVALLECRNAVVRDLCVHSQAGHGLQAHRCEDLTLEHIKIVPQCGLRVSTNCDALHLLSCRGSIVIDGCQTFGQGDDGVNVHGYYYRILLHEAQSCVVRLDTRNGLAHSFEADHPDAGDHVMLVRRCDLAEFAQFQVENVEPAEDHSWKVTLDRPVPELDASEEWLIFSLEQSSANLTIRNCTFASHLARGILVKAKNVLVENNVFYNTALTAMQFLPEVFYAESHTSEHVVIRNNLVYDAGFLTAWAKEYLGAAAILFDLQSKDSSPSFHRDICIENNLIHCPEAAHGIVLKHVADCVVRSNQICTQGEPIVVDAPTCRNVNLGQEVR